MSSKPSEGPGDAAHLFDDEVSVIIEPRAPEERVEIDSDEEDSDASSQPPDSDAESSDLEVQDEPAPPPPPVQRAPPQKNVPSTEPTRNMFIPTKISRPTPSSSFESPKDPKNPPMQSQNAAFNAFAGPRPPPPMPPAVALRPALGFPQPGAQPYTPFAAKAPPFPIPQHQQPYGNQQQPYGTPYPPMPAAYGPGMAQVPDYMTSQESEKVLRDLMEGAVNSEEVELNPEDYEVPGFSEGFKLLHHQVQARKWMASREDANAKRYGGILADDMGLGKTIQALVRIVEGKAKKRDREDGWSGSTLVVVPLAVMNQWADEARKMTSLKVMTHHGASRTADPDVLRKHHIVVTTYDVLKSEHKAFMPDVKDESKAKSKKKKDDYSSDEEEVKPKKRATKVKTAVMEMKWWRIILDEAHTIKNASTQAARACFELKARYRWVLTGTPMQNEVGELFSLFKFLHVKPYHEIERFNTDIAKPFKSGHGMNRALKRLQAVLHAVMLRRRKDTIINGKKLIELPPRELEIVPCSFSAEEQRFYDNLANQMDSKLNDMESEGKANYMGVLLLLLRLRQACNHCALVTKDFKDDLSAVESRPAAKNESQETDADDLANALENLTVTRKCRVCQTDLPSSHDSASITCSRCEEFMNVSEDAGSSKIREMLRILQDIDKQSNGEDKTIIFSQFTSFLDLIEPFFIERGIRWVRYDGSMKPADREIALNRIKTDPKVRIILISFKAGSTGLNLTCCNRVILMDMWWNPALEDQSFDRAHRFGQKKKVNIYKLKVDETVEDRILELQEKKRALAAAALSGDKVKNLKLDMGELLALFRRNGRDDDSDDDDDE